MPRIIAELGPGSSLGTGLAALLAGADNHIALDREVHRNNERNLEIFGRFVVMFNQHARLVSGLFPPTVSLDFPSELVSTLARNLAQAHLAEIEPA